MSDKQKILLIDDEDQFRFMTRMALEAEGFDVSDASGGHEGLTKIKAEKPDLVLLDLNMPEPDGHKVCEMIKNDRNLRQIPVIILTTSDDLNDKLRRLDGGADDYITKNIDSKERSARIRAVIRRNRQNLDSNPLTHLPGNNKIQDVINERMKNRGHFAVAYTDLDNFKAFNDKYGFKRGDEVILFASRVIQQAVQQSADPYAFVGHIGGDDFVIVTSAEQIGQIGQTIIQTLDHSIKEYYDNNDRQAGYITTKNRQGRIEKFPFISISIAVVDNVRHSFTNIGEIIAIVTELKKFAKQQKGSTLVFDKRSD